MKKKQVNEILTNQSKKRTVLFSFLCSIILVSLLALIMLLIYIERNKTQYVSYNENSDIDLLVEKGKHMSLNFVERMVWN